MTPINELSKRQQAILKCITEREGCSMQYLVGHLGTGLVPAASIRRDIGVLRSSGYDIVLGRSKSCDGQRPLYEWVRSVLEPQQVVVTEFGSDAGPNEQAELREREEAWQESGLAPKRPVELDDDIEDDVDDDEYFNEEDEDGGW